MIASSGRHEDATADREPHPLFVEDLPSSATSSPTTQARTAGCPATGPRAAAAPHSSGHKDHPLNHHASRATTPSPSSAARCALRIGPECVPGECEQVRRPFAAAFAPELGVELELVAERRDVERLDAVLHDALARRSTCTRCTSANRASASMVSVQSTGCPSVDRRLAAQWQPHGDDGAVLGSGGRMAAEAHRRLADQRKTEPAVPVDGGQLRRPARLEHA